MEEIDGIDWDRHARAWAAGLVESIEELRRAYLADEISKLDSETWAEIIRHDQLLED